MGVHFALDEDDVAGLCAIGDMRMRLDHLQRNIEERYLDEPGIYAAESVKAWDAMHRALSNGYLSWDGGDFPLNHVVIGGDCLYTEDDYIMSLKTPKQVSEVAEAICPISKEEFRRRYFSIPADDYPVELNEEDFEYTWERFVNVRNLYLRAAADGRYVLFTADQ